MATPKPKQRIHYPLAAYNFRVTVDGVGMRFSKVTGLEREYETLTYRHGLSFVEGEQITKYRVDKYVPITLEQGTVIGQASLSKWLERKGKCPMEISLCDETGTPVIIWRIAKALAIKLTAPSFDAQTNEVCIDSIEIQAAGISIKHLN